MVILRTQRLRQLDLKVSFFYIKNISLLWNIKLNVLLWNVFLLFHFSWSFSSKIVILHWIYSYIKPVVQAPKLLFYYYFRYWLQEVEATQCTLTVMLAETAKYVSTYGNTLINKTIVSIALILYPFLYPCHLLCNFAFPLIFVFLCLYYEDISMILCVK